jgi:hypothetical protein
MPLPVRELDLDGGFGARRANVLGELGHEVRFIEHEGIASAGVEVDMIATPNDVAKPIVSTGNTVFALPKSAGVTMIAAPP